jgi:hypothetical protein
MSNRFPDGTYVYAAPTGPLWEEPPFTPIPTVPSTGLQFVAPLEQPILQRLEALEREVKELKRALADLHEHAEIKSEIAAVRAAMLEMLARMKPASGEVK